MKISDQRQKIFVVLSGLWPLRQYVCGKVRVNPLKRKIRDENLFSDNITDVKADVKQQEIKELVAVSCNVFFFEIQCKIHVYFSLNFAFAWYSIQLDIVH